MAVLYAAVFGFGAVPVWADAPAGDMDGDSKITSADALMILRASVNLVVLTGEQSAAADYNSDGNIDSADALAVLIVSLRRSPDDKEPTDETPAFYIIPGQEPMHDNNKTPDEASKPISGDVQSDIDPRCIKILEFCNAERAKEGITPLEFDTSLSAAAEIRAEEISRSFSHIRPNGQWWYTALLGTDAEYSQIAENIAAGAAPPEIIVKMWMDSEEHRRNIMDPAYTRMCVAVAAVPEDNYYLYWDQLFASD